MIRAFEAVIDEQGNVRLLEAVCLPERRRAVVVVFEDPQAPGSHECALLSEKSLAEDWNRPEEDEAWAYLQRERSS